MGLTRRDFVGMIVTLQWFEYVWAALCGIMRQAEALRRQSPNRVLAPEDYNETHMNAAGAEMAVAKHIGRYWPGGVNVFGEPDIPPDIQVRSSSDGDRHLIVRPKDLDEHKFVFVRGTLPTYEIVGYILGADAKKPAWVRNPHGFGECWIVPDDALKPVPADLCRMKKGGS